MKFFDANQKHEQELFEKLSAESEQPGDDGEGEYGTNPETDSVEGRESGMDATWGEEPGDPVQHSPEVWSKFRQGREELLGTLFDGKKQSDPTEQKLVAGQLDHASSGQFETSSPQLSSKSKTSSAKPETLLEKVARIVE